MSNEPETAENTVATPDEPQAVSAETPASPEESAATPDAMETKVAAPPASVPPFPKLSDTKVAQEASTAAVKTAAADAMASKPVANPVAKKEVGIRRVRMTVSRVDPWSALKLSFLISVAVGIMIVIAAMILWFVLDKMHVWAQINDLLVTLNSESLLKLGQFMEFGRVLSFAVVVGVVEIVLMTAFGTLMAIIYNVIATLVGGMHIMVTDE